MIRAGVSGGSSGCMDQLYFWEVCNGTTRFLNLDAMEAVNFASFGTTGFKLIAPALISTYLD